MVTQIVTDVPIQQVKKFIKANGINSYSPCLCGSGMKYKYCCVKKAKSKNVKSIFAKMNYSVWDKNFQKGDSCLLEGCNEIAIYSHSISEGKYLKVIEPNTKNCITRFILFFSKGDF